MFNPQGFPDGQIVWDLTTSVDREHNYLEVFEQYRRTFVVIGVADYEEGCDPEVLSAQLEDMKSLVSTPPCVGLLAVPCDVNLTRRTE